ncbi:hypothetical protein DACRYDRAFT_110489 [Dacryopinax primogenitus]|uniref:WD40 repeat-like protein n=1 Tax=Dacryopinax primogenitus (strain DJM 731) TaxID=1858805 RepID=M5FS23_DACPD|nr:uncharacterized protein DACRYDRAFT_110489 [Dacryopinax primogenitus]EJT98578.1 hypothetical protein DACRYDRAFT_110489 [Dacryopinax primogenitus]
MLAHRKGTVTLICPVLVSGGLDLAPVLTPAAPVQKTDAHGAGAVANLLKTSKAATWAESWHRRLPYTRRGEMSVLRKRGWVVCRREQAVGIWYLKTVSEGEEGGWEKVLEMELAGKGNLVCIAVGEPGDSQPAWLAVSDGGEVKLWQLLGEKEDIRPKRVKSFIPTVVEQLADSEGTLGASALAFTPSASHLLVATTPSCQPGSTILFLDVADLSVVARLTPPKSANAESWISEIVVSSDGHYCASLDVTGRINICDSTHLPPHLPSAACHRPR